MRFPIDRGGFPRRNVFIPIFDDDVDEADEQTFVVHLVVINALNPGLIIIGESSQCVIVDNDRELFVLVK